MLLVQSQAYKKQFGFNSIVLIPTNLYGPKDNFDLKSAGVIPTLINKIHTAKKHQKDSIILWGDGTPSRDFLFVKDTIDGLILAAEKYNESSPINLGSEEEISIKDLSFMISELMSFTGEIKWDTSKPNGQPRRKVSNRRAEEKFGFRPKVSLRQGLTETIDWYENSI